MSDVDRDAQTRQTPLNAGQYTAASHARHRSGAISRRGLFFMLASVWGFIVGVAGLLAVMSLAGERLQADGVIIAGLIPALVLAAAGSIVIAAAYKESQRRSR
jgi:hypothetical protein